MPEFDARRLAKLAEMERRHFWFRARRRIVLARIARELPAGDGPVLDLGCGTGSMVSDLLRLGRRAAGLDGRPEGVAAAKRADAGVQLVQGDVTRLPFRDRAAAAVLMLDVLEHVDDAAALEEARRALRPGGLLLATVPALPWLWSRRDDDAGHLRRYTRRSFAAAIESAGFRDVDIRYHQFLLLPVVAVSRVAGRGSPRTRDAEDHPPRALDLAFGAVSRVEETLGRAVRWPCGSSLIAVGRSK